MADIITIAGSPSASSRSAAVLAYTRQALEQRGLETHALHVRDLPPEDLIYGRVESPAIVEWASLLGEARAVVIATPVYKAAYSGVLKAFLDLLPQQAFSGKLILPIATGGSPAHQLAIDYALRPVLAALSAHHILNGVYIIDSQVQFDGLTIRLDPAIVQRLETAVTILTDGLALTERRRNGHLGHAIPAC